MSRETLFADLIDINPDALLADGFDGAYIGFTVNQHHTHVAVYDYDKCVEILLQDSLSEEDAHEHMSFNVLGAYVGENGPIFMQRAKHADLQPPE